MSSKTVNGLGLFVVVFFQGGHAWIVGRTASETSDTNHYTNSHFFKETNVKGPKAKMQLGLNTLQMRRSFYSQTL